MNVIKKQRLASVVALLTLSANVALTPNAYSADLSAGKAKSAVCASCHGTDGIGKTAIYPNLAGQKADYLAKQLRAFKSGQRADTSMRLFATPLSDEDIDNLAAYYASLPANPAPCDDESNDITAKPSGNTSDNASDTPSDNVSATPRDVAPENASDKQ